MMDFSGLTKTVHEIRKIIETSSGGSNADALNDVREKLFRIEQQCDGDSYTLEKLGSLKIYAAVLFSASKAQKYGGADNVRGFMYADCQNILQRLNTLDNTK
jgi:hypothetical protein